MAMLKYAKIQPQDFGTTDEWRNRLHVIRGDVGAGKSSYLVALIKELSARLKKKDGVKALRNAIWVSPQTAQLDKIGKICPGLVFMTPPEFLGWLNESLDDPEFIEDDASKLIIFDDMARSPLFNSQRDNRLTEFILSRRHHNALIFVTTHRLLDLPMMLRQYMNFLTSFSGTALENRHVADFMSRGNHTTDEIIPLLGGLGAHDSVTFAKETGNMFRNNIAV